MTAVALRSAFVFLAVVGTTLALAGCGSSTKMATGQGLSVDVTIAHGQVTPANVTLQATVRQPITLHVTSDAADELHVHSVPDHKFEVAAAANQTFQFSVDVPGSVDVELHHLDRTVATIQVRP
jgi:outer membrane murein-binding lipoprotein Lpp